METHYFYGVCGNTYKLDDVVLEAIEDESDGYRSYLESIEVVENLESLTFFPSPIALVQEEYIEEYCGFKGYRYIDCDEHVWLEVGTCYCDDFYPCFVFNYFPKDPAAYKQK